MRAVKGQWVYTLHVGRDPRYADRGWRVFGLVFGRMRRDLPEGVNVSQRDVWGLCIYFCFWLPFERY